ncbi:MAG: AAA family ATPase [Bacteroidota bacterium]|jgi:hypothetical protein
MTDPNMSWIYEKSFSVLCGNTNTTELLYRRHVLELHSRALKMGLKDSAAVVTTGFSKIFSPVFEQFEQRVHEVALELGCKPFSLTGRDIENSSSHTGVSSETRNGFSVLYIGDSTCIFFERNSASDSLEVTTTDKEALSKLAALKTEFQEKEEKPQVNLLVLKYSSPEIRKLEVFFGPLIRENYSPSVLSDFDKIVETLQSPNPFGRLVILDGPQGTGKSYMIRGLVKAIPPKEASFLFIPASMVPSLSGPSLLTFLLDFNKGKKTILVVEDADEALVKRDGSNDAQVSTLLNLTDGILGELLDIRVVCTTNRKLEDIDKAIRRNGRLACHSHLGVLSTEQSRSVYLRLAGALAENLPTGPTALADIYALALNEGRNSDDDRQAMGFNTTKLRVVEK